MKKLFLLVALVSAALTSYAQKPNITLDIESDGFFKTITITASQAVPESVICGGQYQAPSNTTGNWYLELQPGMTSLTLSVPDLVENVPVAFDYIIVNNSQYYFDMSFPPYTTNYAHYYIAKVQTY